MIVKEFYAVRDDGVRLFETKSDSGFAIVQNETGIVYGSAIDVEDAPFTYTETDIVSAENEITNEEAYSIIMGVRE